MNKLVARHSTWGKSRLILALMLALVLWVVPTGVFGWLSYDGEDPIIRLDGGKTLRIVTYQPDGAACSITGPIQVAVALPANVGGTVVAESHRGFPCGTVTSQTSLSNGAPAGQAQVTVLVNASQSFPVRAEVTLYGKGQPRQVVLEGNSNTPISGSINLN